MRFPIREQLLSEHRAARMLNHVLADHSAMAWLKRDRVNSPTFNSVMHRGVPHYFATEVFRFAKGIARTPAALYLVALEIYLDNRSGQERRAARRRRSTRAAYFGEAIARERRQMDERRFTKA